MGTPRQRAPWPEATAGLRLGLLLALGIAAASVLLAPAATLARRHRHHPKLTVSHPGCHQYCQQAGGYGGGPPGRPVVKFLGPVRVSHDGMTAALGLRCVFRKGCRGAVLLSLNDAGSPELGRSDMALRRGQAQSIQITLTPSGRDALAHRPGDPVPVVVTADAGVTASHLGRRATKRWDFVVGGRLSLYRA